MMDGTGIELYVHLEKLEEEVEQFNNVSKNFGDYMDMYKRQMDIIRYSKMADELYDMPALVRTYDEFVEEADRLNKFSKALQDIYKEYKTCNDTYTQMGIDLGNQYAITPWAKTNEGKIVIGTSIIVGSGDCYCSTRGYCCSDVYWRNDKYNSSHYNRDSNGRHGVGFSNNIYDECRVFMLYGMQKWRKSCGCLC